MTPTDSPSRKARRPARRYNRIFVFIIGLGCFAMVCFIFNVWMVEIFLPENNVSITNLPYGWISSRRQHQKSIPFVHEMPPVPLMQKPPPVYMMIPTVPRKDNPPYLHQVLESFNGFPLSRIYVFHNGPPGSKHSRWEEARELFSGAHYIRNEAPVPKGHPSVFDLSLPLPPEIQDHIEKFNDTQISMARNDTQDRKDWRRKECFDFTLMSRYMLNVIDDSVRKNETWIIFNQDDAKWRVPFSRIYEVLQSASTARVDLNRLGLVSAAFRADALSSIVDAAPLWCDFKPVDWMVWTLSIIKGYCEICARAPKGLVIHIGKVSTRHGTIKGAEEAEKAARAKAAKARLQALAQKKAEAQAKAFNLTGIDVALVRSLLNRLEKMEDTGVAPGGVKGAAQVLDRPKTVPAKANR